MNVIAVYPGRFHPFHKGHAASFKQLAEKFGLKNTYLAISAKQDQPKSPFSAQDRAKMATALGIPPKNIIAVSNPYSANEYIAKVENDGGDVNNTALVFGVSKKDMEGDPEMGIAPDPRFSFKNKKDGSASYMQPYSQKAMQTPAPMTKHGYIMSTDVAEFPIAGQTMRDASAIRQAYAGADIKKKMKILTDLYGDAAETMKPIFDNNLQITEHVRRLIATIKPMINEATPAQKAKFVHLLSEAKQRLDPACWSGKHKEGTKMKNGRRVNNCVSNESIEESNPNLHRRFDSKTLDTLYQAQAYGREVADLNKTKKAERAKERGTTNAPSIEIASTTVPEAVIDGYIKNRKIGTDFLLRRFAGKQTVEFQTELANDPEFQELVANFFNVAASKKDNEVFSTRYSNKAYRRHATADEKLNEFDAVDKLAKFVLKYMKKYGVDRTGRRVPLNFKYSLGEDLESRTSNNPQGIPESTRKPTHKNRRDMTIVRDLGDNYYLSRDEQEDDDKSYVDYAVWTKVPDADEMYTLVDFVNVRPRATREMFYDTIDKIIAADKAENNVSECDDYLPEK
jgi:cytidyltransferase-like protein